MNIFQKSDILIHKKLFIIELKQINCVLCLLHLTSEFLFHFFYTLSFYQWYTCILHNYLCDYVCDITFTRYYNNCFVVTKLLYSTCMHNTNKTKFHNNLSIFPIYMLHVKHKILRFKNACIINTTNYVRSLKYKIVNLSAVLM